MGIAGIDPKCYILALFVRDDGVRFLLGDDPYEFKDKQLHFQPNTVANDVVEVQGNDGYLLAGQVRRPGSQSFDGYVGNGTNSKSEVESKRRAFLQFFRRSHFYKVIYVFPNGTAIQRKQGFLVDDPTVQELYQQYPEYHVALNFEDVNYYTYEEDDQGQEIYAESAIIPLAGGGATGGLIWDNYGVVWENPWSLPISVSGREFQILNNAGARAPLQNLQLLGDTEQKSYSGKNLMNQSEFQQGAISANTGAEEETTTRIRSPFIAVESGTYTVSNGNGFYVVVDVYDSNKAFLRTESFTSWQQVNAFTFAITNGKYVRVLFRKPDNTATITPSELTSGQLELGSTATSFEPYVGGISAPNPDYPQAVQTVTGEQTVTVSDGVNSEDFTISLGSVEFCKIGNYRDYIYKSGDDWYVHKDIGKYNLTGQEDWRLHPSVGCFYDAGNSYGTNGGKTPSKSTILPNILSSAFIEGTYQRIWSDGTRDGIAVAADGTSNPRIRVTNITTLPDFKDMITEKQPEIYYPLAAPTDAQITDATLIGQLNALGAMKLFIGENNLLVSATGTNLPATLEFSYPTKFAAIGAEWEEGGTKGATIVDVNAIDNTYPVWELIGPAVNPTISVLTTNTTLTYNGTITASQKLVIDMFNKTATLNGTSLIGNISGDFVYMAPGSNRIAYTAGNTDAPDSNIYWQEVVG